MRVAKRVIIRCANTALASRLGLVEQRYRLFEVLAAYAVDALGVTISQPAAQAAEQRSRAFDAVAALPHVRHADQRSSESQCELMLPVHPQERSLFIAPRGIRSTDSSSGCGSGAAGSCARSTRDLDRVNA